MEEALMRHSVSTCAIGAALALGTAIVAFGCGGSDPNDEGAASESQALAAMWRNRSIATQAGSFSASFDAVPSRSAARGENAVMGLSSAAASATTDLAASVRFAANGIEARNGGDYSASTKTPY